MWGKTIQSTIDSLLEYTKDEDRTESDPLDTTHIYILLIGGLVRKFYPQSSHCIGDVGEPYLEMDYGPPDLTQWVNGFGHIPHIYPQDFEEHGYIPISKYLQETVPQ
ncbi:hypothetical protein VP01_2980g4, partial [Puccinia sorghi]